MGHLMKKAINIMIEEKQLVFFRKNNLKIGAIVRQALAEKIQTMELQK